jgi:hypothetical protein
MADKLDGAAIVANSLPATAIVAGSITTTQLAPSVANVVTVGSNPKIASLDYPGDDTAANTGGGQTVVISGSGFKSNVSVYINGNAVPSVTYTNANSISITTPALAAATYPLYVINTDDGGTAILIPGIQYSGTPSWVTTSPLDGQQALSAWSISLSATSDSSVTYTLQAGSSLPTGISLAANGLISGTMSSPPADDTTYNFTVVATDAELQDASKAFSVAVTVAVDTQFQYTTLLLQADGTNNGNNHAFLDSSNNNFTITRNGNATQGSFTPFSPTGWSNYFDGNGDQLSSNTAAISSVGSGDFCFEGWFYFLKNTNTYTQALITYGIVGDTSGTSYISFQCDSSGYPAVAYATGGSLALTSSVLPPVNQWSHLVLCRTGSNLSIFLNGVRTGTTTTSATVGSGGNALTIGGQWYENASTRQFQGYISNVRIVRGSSPYNAGSTSFTVPIAPLTAIANTTLLTCQSNRFIDNSVNAYTITRAGDVSVHAFSPFAPTAAYSTANVGGSLYLDGTGDYLQATSGVSTQFDTGSAFTVECWVYQLSYASDGNIFGVSGSTVDWNATTGIYLNWYTYSGNLYWQTSLGNGQAVSLITATLPGINQWHHFAVGFNGTTTRMWINGTSVGTSTQGYTRPSGTNRWQVGSTGGGASILNGYISGLRYVKGTDVYGVGNSSITVPTSPPSNIANTSLLCNFTNAGIFDQTAKNVLETVGDAKISTSVYKYGTGSIAFDGTGDYLILRKNPLIQFGTGDFTIEGWTYLVSKVSNFPCIFSNYNAFTNGNGSLGLFAGHNSANTSKYQLALNGTGFPSIQSSTSIAYNSWVHLAVVRYNGVITLYINGVADGTVSFSGTLNGAGDNCTIGYSTDEASTTINGYVDDFRITRGIARYTQSFTPPTTAFLTK